MAEEGGVMRMSSTPTHPGQECIKRRKTAHRPSHWQPPWPRSRAYEDAHHGHHAECRLGISSSHPPTSPPALLTSHASPNASAQALQQAWPGPFSPARPGAQRYTFRCFCGRLQVLQQHARGGIVQVQRSKLNVLATAALSRAR